MTEYDRITCPICSEDINVAQRLSRAGYTCPTCDGKRVLMHYAVTKYNTNTLIRNPLRSFINQIEIVDISPLEKPELNIMFKKYRIELIKNITNYSSSYAEVKSVHGYDEFPYTNILIPAIRLIKMNKGGKVWVYTTEAPTTQSPDYSMPHLELEGAEKRPVITTVRRSWEEGIGESNSSNNLQFLQAEFAETTEHKNRYNKKISEGFFRIQGNLTTPKIRWVDARILDQLGIYTSSRIKSIYFGKVVDESKNIKQDVLSNEEGSFYGWMNPISMAARIRNLLICPEITTAGLVGYNGTATSCGRSDKPLVKNLGYFSQGDEEDEDLDDIYEMHEGYCMGGAHHSYDRSQINRLPKCTLNYNAQLETSIEETLEEEDISTFLIFDEQE